MREDILTIQALADYLQIDEKTAYRMAQRGELPGFKVRRQWRFKRADIDAWIESGKRSVAAASTAAPPPVARAHPIPAASEQGPLRNRGRK